MAPPSPHRGGRRALTGERAHHDLSPPLPGGERPPQLDDDAAVPLDWHRLRARRVHVGRDRTRALLLGSGRARRQRKSTGDPLAPDSSDRPMRARFPPARVPGLRVLRLGGLVGRTVDATPRRGTQTEAIVVVWAAILAVITLLSILPIFLYNVDLSTLSFGSDIPIVVGVGILLTGYAPAFAALLAVRVVPGSGGIRRLLAPAVRWRVHPIWYLIAILGPIGLFLVGDVIRSLLGLEVPSAWLALPSASALTFLAGALIAGSFGEEVGWRGLAQPRLQQRRGALAAAMMVGVLWSLWHLWPVLTPGGLAMTGVSRVGLT